MYTERQLKEIAFALMYRQFFNHGTDGHNRLNILAEIANKDFYIVCGFNSVTARPTISLFGTKDESLITLEMKLI